MQFSVFKVTLIPLFIISSSFSMSALSQNEDAKTTAPNESIIPNNTLQDKLDTDTDSEFTNPPPVPASTQDDLSDSGNKEKDSTTDNKSSIERVTPDTTHIRILDVSRFLQQNNRAYEITQFPLDDKVISGLYLPENTGNPQGGILILHDIEQHPHWPETVAPLREYLPDYGWNTLSLFLENRLAKPLPNIPNPNTAVSTNTDINNKENKTTEEDPASLVSDEVQLADRDLNLDEPQDDRDPEAVTTEDSAPAEIDDELSNIANALEEIPTLNTEPEDTTKNEVNKTPEEQYQEDAMKWVSSGMNHLNNLGQFNLVIIAHGFSANWAVAALLEKYVQTPNAKGYSLILIDASPSEYPYYPLDSKLATLDIPMLDIYTSQLDYEIRIATLRKNSMQRARRNQYLQLRFPKIRTNLTGKHNLLSRRVRGWLKSHAAGEEVQVKVK